MTKEKAIKYVNAQLDKAVDDADFMEDEMYDALQILVKIAEQEPCDDIMTIHTQGLDEGIRCAMCTNSMRSDMGCDGGCVVNEDMYKEVMNTIKNHIVPPATPTRKKGKWIKEYDNPALDGLYHCSVCGRKVWILKVESASDYPYCHCGAEMESEE